MRHKHRNIIHCISAAALLVVIASCAGKEKPPAELKYFPITKDTNAVSKDGLSFDGAVSKDGNGSFKLQSEGERTVFRLFEIDHVNVESSRLIYRAKVKTESAQGKVYLEMWCGFEGKGEFFSRSLDSSLMGTNDWSTVETPFFWEAGQKLSSVKLNLIVEGKGTAWIDDVHLVSY
jgi:hypothetical protein